jgi:hypothetical protein
MMGEAPDPVHNQRNEGTQQHKGQAKNQNELRLRGEIH